MTIPGSKEAYRLIGEDGQPILDLLIRKGEAPPIPGRRMMCRHPFNERQRAWVTAAEVLPLHTLVWDGSTAAPAASVTDTRQYVKDQLNMLRQVRRREKEREREREGERPRLVSIKTVCVCYRVIIGRRVCVVLCIKLLTNIHYTPAPPL